ncbi:hypothetical protein PybrP1_000862 [[Pythium] brassicae (nom. inval.)]|nr:hypothetical protein PybrP1_000862 [[Pythium] brassicae (nom. inval.)]
MKHRWMDVVKRGKDALSPRSDSSGTYAARTPPPRSQARAQSLTVDMLVTAPFRLERAENPAFFHLPERCKSGGGACSVSSVLEQCVLQGGVHHTHLNVLTHLGAPLRADTCCYGLSVQWFRAFGAHDDFQAIPGACAEFFTATADDIGARILVKVMLEDEDVVKTKMLEYGPIKEDPEVRSKVEMYLERKSVLFMGLQSIAVRDGDEYPDDVELRSWTLLIDDRRVRLTCESSLIPPFETLYTCDIKVEVVRSTPNEFCLHLAESCYVHLRAESNVVRDIIVLTLRAFCGCAVASGADEFAPALDEEEMDDDSLLLDAEALIVNAMRMSPVAADTAGELLADSDLDRGSFEEALRTFEANYVEDAAAGATHAQYAAILSAMQRELSEAKRRVAALTQQLDEKSEENAAFRGDIRTLQSALTAMQVADKVNELVTDDLKQLVQSKRAISAGGDVSATMPLKPLPENYY